MSNYSDLHREINDLVVKEFFKNQKDFKLKNPIKVVPHELNSTTEVLLVYGVRKSIFPFTYPNFYDDAGQVIEKKLLIGENQNDTLWQLGKLDDDIRELQARKARLMETLKPLNLVTFERIMKEQGNAENTDTL